MENSGIQPLVFKPKTRACYWQYWKPIGYWNNFFSFYGQGLCLVRVLFHMPPPQPQCLKYRSERIEKKKFYVLTWQVASQSILGPVTRFFIESLHPLFCFHFTSWMYTMPASLFVIVVWVLDLAFWIYKTHWDSDITNFELNHCRQTSFNSQYSTSIICPLHSWIFWVFLPNYVLIYNSSPTGVMMGLFPSNLTIEIWIFRLYCLVTEVVFFLGSFGLPRRF